GVIPDFRSGRRLGPELQARNPLRCPEFGAQMRILLHHDASPELSVRQALDALIKAGIYSAEGGGTINDRCQVQFTSYRCADGALFDSQEYASANGLPTRD